MKNPQQIGTAVIVINSKNQVLLGKRKNGFRSGTYGMPGGRVDRGEKLLECAKRELKEETGLDATSISHLGVVKEWQPSQDHDFVHFIFVCDSWEGKPIVVEPEKCENWEWYSLDSLPEDTLTGHKAAIDLLADTATSGTNEQNLKDI